MYDPYSYYSLQHNHDSRFISPYASLSSTHPAPGPSSPRRQRRDSIWSTSSICSQSSLDDDNDDYHLHLVTDSDACNDVSSASSPVHDILPSPVSPAESSCSSSSSLYSRFHSSARPRGPRPLPALPTSQPSSPSSPSSSLLPFSYQKAFVPPLRLNVKDLAPPPSYEEAVNSAHSPLTKPSWSLNSLSLTLAVDNTSDRPTCNVRERDLHRERPRPHSLPTRPRPTAYPFDHVSPSESVPEFMTSPLEDSIIDWAQIEEILVNGRA